MFLRPSLPGKDIENMYFLKSKYFFLIQIWSPKSASDLFFTMDFDIIVKLKEIQIWIYLHICFFFTILLDQTHGQVFSGLLKTSIFLFHLTLFKFYF